jgi:hypothetical protein
LLDPPEDPPALPEFSDIWGSEDSIEEETDRESDDNDNIEEEEQHLSFTSTWCAMAGKEQFPGARSIVYIDGDIEMSDLLAWKAEVLLQAHPRQFDIAKFEAIVSYERCRASDECPQQIQTDSDLTQVMGILRMWFNKWPKRSFTIRTILRVTEKKEALISNRQPT